MGDKPAVLILGGVGFIGRNLTQFIVEHDLAREVRIVDKVRTNSLALACSLSSRHGAGSKGVTPDRLGDDRPEGGV